MEYRIKYLLCKKLLAESNKIYIAANGLINNKTISIVSYRQCLQFLKYFPRYWNGGSLAASYLGSDTRYYARNNP